MQPSENEFALDLRRVRERARAAARSNDRDKPTMAKIELCRLLNEALATELVCVLRYKHHGFKCKGVHGKIVAAEFFEHAREEMEHAEQIAARIDELGGEPDFSPNVLLDRAHTEYVIPSSLIGMLREDLTAELIAIDTYTELIRHIGDRDPTTRRLLERVLQKEEEHANDLAEMLEELPALTPPAD
jgi:bacterioferritin